MQKISLEVGLPLDFVERDLLGEGGVEQLAINVSGA